MVLSFSFLAHRMGHKEAAGHGSKGHGDERVRRKGIEPDPHAPQAKIKPLNK